VRIAGVLTFVLMILLCSSANAGWVMVGENKELGLTIYSDLKSVKGGPRDVQLLTLYNFKSVNHQFGHNHLSETEVNEYDCELKKVHLLEFSWYKKAMGKGLIVWSAHHAQPWSNIPLGSVHMTNLMIVCKSASQI
jgi:hypothetical protein